MGICSSHEITPAATAKLILQDGQLEEFSYPVTVSQILKGNHSCFVCKADDMDYNACIPAIDGDEELQLGQLYFVLPVNWINSRLSPRDMAALAVKASLALKSSGGHKILPGIRRIVPMLYASNKKAVECSRMVGNGCGGCGDGDSHSGKGLECTMPCGNKVEVAHVVFGIIQGKALCSCVLIVWKG
ncbi:hypothetical protein GH714_041916 [Hevea brasiliensis]|uniref:Uncharacterized protein n=1 Tax=Hevea brasiliensis TaxID=3981 RepID=A0A6A6MVF4_HEVBR|nr:hypothetical protein GH714_041916 [Hevea brasiliensis]